MLVATADYFTPAGYDVAVFYGLSIALCAWTRSRKFTWAATSVFVGLIFCDIPFGGSPHIDLSSIFVNRCLTAFALFVIAALVHNWIGDLVAVEEQRNWTRSLVTTLDQAQVIIRKLDGTVLLWSQGAERLYGWTAESAVGKRSHELFEADVKGERLDDIQRQLVRDGKWSGELLYSRKDGTPLWVASHWTLQTNGRFPYPVVIEVNNDITQLKTAETRFRNLTELMPNLVWQTTPDGRTTYANQRWLDFFGRRPDESTQVTFSELVHPDDLVRSRERWANALQTGRMDPWEVRYRRHDNVYHWFAGRAVAVRNDAGELLYWIATATDIEEEKKTAERLRETQKLESIGRLAGGVAHDFNNLLTAITGYNSFLKEEVGSNEVAAGYALEITKAAERAAALTAQLLSFSRPQFTKPQLVNLNATLTDVTRILARVIGEDIELKIRLAPELPNVLADPVQLDQVIMNLAVNARDAMPNGGVLRLETGTAFLRAEKALERQVASGLYVTLTAQDTGAGMDEATRLRLFEPFFTTKTKGKGTGLGLSIVHGIVKHSGGSIQVDSTVGSGAQFTVYLPAATRSEKDDIVAPVEKTVTTRKGTILVVEDEDSVRHLVCVALRQRGHTVLDASTPAAGIQLSQEYGAPIDLVISDVLMPQMRGPELVSRIRESRRDLSVLYMSGYSDSTFLDPSALEGADYIQKPFQPVQLTELVSTILNKRRP